jgi:adenosylcobinamide-GDP ribazoletransferase
MLPVALLWWYVGEMPHPLLFLVPLAVELFLALWMKSRIGGYTGDCCGATFLLSEASMFLTFLIITPL